MRHRISGRKLGRDIKERKALFLSLARGLIINGEIKTTLAKAKTIRGYLEKMITVAKKGDLSARRNLQSQLRKRELVNRLVDEVAPQFKDRPGGYLRIIKLGERRGDRAFLAKIEFVSKIEPLKKKEKAKTKRGQDQASKKKKPTLPETAGKKGNKKNGN